MIFTRINELFGTRHPIVQYAVPHASSPELVAAVSNAGGLGLLPATGYVDPVDFEKAVQKTKELTQKPFGLSYGFWVGKKGVDPERFLSVARENDISVVELSAMNSYLYTDMLKSWDIRVVHSCKTVGDARNSAKAGCDAVILEGFEGHGFRGDLDVGSMVNIPACNDGLRIPVIASGGFADGRGLVAALALGAEGVAMTTRFIMTVESGANPGVKGYLIQALEGDTILVDKSPKNSLRVLKTPVTEKLYLKKKWGENPEPVSPGPDPLETGDFSQGLLSLGQSIGMIRDIPTVDQLMKNIIEEANSTLKRVQLLFG